MINLLSYNSSFLQGRNVRLAHAKLLLEHFVCVLAQHRWHGADRRLGFGEFDRSVDHFYRATEVMFHLNDHVTRPCVGMVQRGLYVVHGRVRHPAALEHLQPLLGGLLL